MTKLEELMKRPYKLELIEDPDEGGFVASYPELRGCITCAETAKGAVDAAKDAKRAWLEAALSNDFPIPPTSS